MDDMLVKSPQITDHVWDLEEAFSTLRRHQMKLNLTKCAFGVTSEKFFDFFMSQRRIEINLKKIKVIIIIKYPTFKKEIQQLNGRIAALSRLYQDR